jgi:Carboxypeptidase regulatory-like domain/TonB dependent receptor
MAIRVSKKGRVILSALPGSYRNVSYRIFLALLLMGSLSSLFGQSTTGTILGTVRDPSGRAVVAAKVEVVNQGTDARRTTVTNDQGDFRFADIDVGTYVLVLEAPGFQREEFARFDLLARETRRLDATLRVASQTQLVNVESSAGPAVQTDTSNVSETKTGRELVDLPVAIATRAGGSTSPISTLTTQPGVQTDNQGNISVVGSNPSQLALSIDGVSVVGPRAAETGPITELFPSFNAIEEIRVSETINPAEFGGVADIATISKGGTNSYHGGAFENFQNSAMNAADTFTHTVPTLKMNDFGIFLGGPVWLPKVYNGHNKTFFFGSYEALRLPRQQIQIESVPSVAMRSGDLTALGGPVLAPTQISPLSAKILQYLYPLPNFGPPGATTNNYAAYFSDPINSSQGDLRLDQNISSRQQAFVHMTYKNRRLERPPFASPPSSPSPLSGAFSQPEIDYAISAGYTFIVSPTMVNELRGGAAGNHYATTFGIQASTIASELGLSGYSVPPGDAAPNVVLAGYQGTGGTASSQGANRSLQFLDTLTWTKGKHTLKFGGDYRYLNGLYTNVFASRRLGRFNFNGSVSSDLLTNGVVTPYEPYEAFLLGIPDSTSIATVIQPNTESYSSAYSTFAQDDWKVSSRLTLNFGLRYEYHPMMRDHLNNVANFIPDYTSVVDGQTVNGAVVIPNQSVYSILNPAFAQSIYPTPILTAAQAGLPESLRVSQKTDFAPRFGFAWKPFSSDRTVIRGGWGKFIEALMGSMVDDAWGVETSDVANFTNSIVGGKPIYTFPYPFPSNLAQPGSQAFYEAFDPRNYKDPYVEEWDLTVEHDLGKGVGVRVSYDGNHGTHLGVVANANEVQPNTLGFTAASALAPFPLWDYIAYQKSVGESNYNALTVAVQKRFSSGLQFQASYIWTKNLSDNAGYDPVYFTGEGGGTISDIYNPKLDYGNVSFSRRQRFLATFLYELPVGKGKLFARSANRFVDRVIGGWELAGYLMFQTGPYMTILAGNDPSGTGFPELVGDGRADAALGISPYAGQSLNQWINPSAFATPANNIGRFGDSLVGAVTGPGTQSVSLSLFKSVAITERIRMQIGASAANLFNHPNYDVPSDLTLGTSGFAQIGNLQSAEGAGPRSLQLTGRINF